MIDRDHIGVLQTLYAAGKITKQAMHTIRGQVKKMDWKNREEYLKRIIKRTANQEVART